MNEQMAQLRTRIARLESDLAVAVREIGVLQKGTRRNWGARSAVMTTVALIAAGSLAVGAKTPVSRFKAPFEVVDRQGKLIFGVSEDPRGWQLRTSQGEPLVVASALPAGGFVKALAPGGGRQVAVGVAGASFAGMVSRIDATQARATLGIGADGKGTLELLNDNSIVVSHLGVGASGGGLLQIANAGGSAMIEGGVTASGVGLVRAYPLGTPGAGFVGMPGTFIMGRLGN